ncbi:MAG: DUF433 domain-containing protein [Zavarzinella sp.]|nr:DUF433 domain-containing protein [Zavarzinella sp.]
MPDWQKFLMSDPEVCHGRLVAAGTRVPVTTILDSLAEGVGRDDILKSYPSLRPEHIDAAIAYAAETHLLAQVAGMFKDDRHFESRPESIAKHRRDVDAEPDCG